MTTSATLTPAQLKELRAIAFGGKSRSYKPELIDFVHSGEIYRDVMEREPWSEKKIDSVALSFGNNLKTLKLENPDWPEIVVKKQEDKVLLINMTALTGALTEDENESE